MLWVKIRMEASGRSQEEESKGLVKEKAKTPGVNEGEGRLRGGTGNRGGIAGEQSNLRQKWVIVSQDIKKWNNADVSYTRCI